MKCRHRTVYIQTHTEQRKKLSFTERQKSEIPTYSLFGGLATSLQVLEFLFLLVILFLEFFLLLHIHLLEGHLGKAEEECHME